MALLLSIAIVLIPAIDVSILNGCYYQGCSCTRSKAVFA